MDNKVHVIIGSSCAGKSTIKDLIEKNDSSGMYDFIPKATTRPQRVNEDQNVEHLTELRNNKSFDIGYFGYGHDYAIKSEDLYRCLDSGRSPVVITISFTFAEILKQMFGENCSATYVHRPITQRTIRDEMKQRSEYSSFDVSGLEEQVAKRFDVARELFQSYAKSSLFDSVVLNCGSYESLCQQVENIFFKENLSKVVSEDTNHLFVVSGASDDAKSLIAKYFTQFGGQLNTIVTPKQTTRAKKDDDGDEIICVDAISSEFDIRYEAHGHMYGIKRSEIAHYLDIGYDVILVASDEYVVDTLKTQFENKMLRAFIQGDENLVELRSELEAIGLDTRELTSRIAKYEEQFLIYCQNPMFYDVVMINWPDVGARIEEQLISKLNFMRGG